MTRWSWSVTIASAALAVRKYFSAPDEVPIDLLLELGACDGDAPWFLGYQRGAVLHGERVRRARSEPAKLVSAGFQGVCTLGVCVCNF